MSRPFRYTFIMGLVALATALAAVGGWRYARASAPVNGPIVLISIDSLRADHLSAYGYRALNTPAIDQLAADGIVFERAYAHVPQTLPAHATLMTGRLPFETGVRDDVGDAISERERLLAEILKDRDFETGAVVSNVALRGETGIARGFSFFDDAMPDRDGDSGGHVAARSSEDAEQIAEQWLGQTNSSRRFLFIHFDDRHASSTSPESLAQDSYDAAIARTDATIGHLVRYLKAHQLYDLTTIVLLSDHGEGLGDHGEQAHGLFIYDEALRVPLIIKQIANQGAGRRVTDVVQHLDVMPTILDFAKAPVPGNLSGRSLKPLLDGTATFPHRLLYAESQFGHRHFGWAELQAISDGNFKYISAPTEELYDLRTDPGERASIDDEKQLATWRDKLKRVAGRATPSRAVAMSGEVREQLAELGSVGEPPAARADSPADPKETFPLLEEYRKATALSAAKEWPAAMAVLRGIIKSHGDVVDIWMRIAQLESLLGHDAQAALAYDRIVALEPSNTSARLAAANALLHLHRFDEAQSQVQVVADVDGVSDAVLVDAHKLLAEIALARRDTTTARRQASQVVELDPKSPFNQYVEGRLLFDKARYADALTAFEAAEESATPVENLDWYTGEALMRLLRYDDAVTAFTRQIDKTPLDLRVRISLASAHERDGRPDDAVNVLEEATRVLPTPDAFAAAIAAIQRLGRRDQAAELRAEARRRFAEPRTLTTQ